MRGLIAWLKYSGVSLSITANPYHWQWRPWMRLGSDDIWPAPNRRSWAIGWIMLTIRIWIDDGKW